MTKIVFLNDTHCGIRNSSDVFLDYQAKFYDDVLFPYMIENNITQIIHLGDYYDHRKFINFKALNHNRRHFLDRLRELKITMDIIPGNHDIFYKNTSELNSPKELLGFYMNEVNIVMNPRVLEYGDMKIALMPWINEENYEESMKFAKHCKTDMMAGHFEFSGFDMYKGIPAEGGMDPSLFSRFELVVSGHFHTASEAGNIRYFGSQMEFTWSDVDDPKYFHVLDTSTREITPVRNPHTLFKKFNYNDELENYDNFDFSIFDNKFVKVVVIKRNDIEKFNNFTDAIEDRPIHDLKIAEDFSEFIGSSVEDEKIIVEDTEVLLDSYIDSTNTELDKNILKRNMRDLLIEAQVTEIV